MFKTLTIKNFRGIQELKIDNLNQINIFVGENGIGKTTLLEALYITINPNNTFLSFKTNFFRGIDDPANNPNFWQTFFYHFTEQNTIKISLSNKNKNRSLEILPKYITPIITLPNKGEGEDKNLNFNIPSEEKLLGLEVKFLIDKKSYQSKIEQTGPQDFKMDGDEKYQEDLQGNYLNNATFADKASIASKLSSIFKQKRKSDILSLLQKFKSSIVDILLDDKRNILVDDEDFSKKMVYVNTYGSGLMHALHIGCTVLADLADIVLIDEIETGLHSKYQIYIWESILDFLKTRKETQLFVTTHSYEMIKQLNEVTKNESKENLISVFRLEKDSKGSICPVSYTEEELQYALKTHDEIR